MHENSRSLPFLYQWMGYALFFWLCLACFEACAALVLQALPAPLGNASFPSPRDLRFFIAAISLYSLLSIPTALLLYGMSRVMFRTAPKSGISGTTPAVMDYFLLFCWGLLFFKWISTLLPYLTDADHLPHTPYLLIIPLLGLYLWLHGRIRNYRHRHRVQWIALFLGAVLLSRKSYEAFIISPFGVFGTVGLLVLFAGGALCAALMAHSLLQRIFMLCFKPRFSRVLLCAACIGGGLLITFKPFPIGDHALPGPVKHADLLPHRTDLNKNAVVIVVDCLRPDHMGCYGYARNTSPHMDSIAAEGVLFENCIAPSSWTIPSVVSLFTGLYPQQHRVNQPETIIPEAMTSLQALMTEKGMNTAAFITNDYLSRHRGYARGFGRYFDHYLRRGFKEDAASRLFFLNALIYFKNEFLYPYAVDPGSARWWSIGFPPFNHDRISAERVTDDLIAWLEHHGDAPFYIYVHYMDVHCPYDTSWYPLFDREGYDAQDEKGKLINIYDGRVVYVDRQIKRIWDALERLSLSDTTLLMVTADHGEELYDHRGAGHCTTLYDELIKVPLLLINPLLGTEGEGLRIKRQVELIDLPVTVLDFLGMEIPQTMEGDSLLAAIHSPQSPEASWALSYTTRGRKSLQTEEGRRLWEEKVWDQGIIMESLRVDNEWKIFLGNDGRRELYRLEGDSREADNLAERERETFARLEEMLKEITSGLTVPVYDKQESDLSPETMQQLKALGYL